jgi:hypothetical protein
MISAIGEDAQPTLVRLLRQMYPHEALSDEPYVRTANALLDDAAAQPGFAAALVQGLADLGSGLDLARVAETSFFRELRTRAVMVFYSEREVWELIAYEGPSFEQGGYLQRGFGDLDWLPDPPL